MKVFEQLKAIQSASSDAADSLDDVPVRDIDAIFKQSENDGGIDSGDALNLLMLLRSSLGVFINKFDALSDAINGDDNDEN
jgi:acyl carrier protein